MVLELRDRNYSKLHKSCLPKNLLKQLMTFFDQSVQIEAENERLNGELGLVNTKLKRLEIELRLVLIAVILIHLTHFRILEKRNSNFGVN